jgi:hypothetical protein
MIIKVFSVYLSNKLQIAQAQRKDITGQSIFQIANRIPKNPNGIFTKLVLRPVKQDQMMVVE